MQVRKGLQRCAKKDCKQARESSRRPRFVYAKGDWAEPAGGAGSRRATLTDGDEEGDRTRELDGTAGRAAAARRPTARGGGATREWRATAARSELSHGVAKDSNRPSTVSATLVLDLFQTSVPI